MDYRIGVDIGGTSVKLGVVSEDFAVAEVSRIPTGKHASAEAIIISIIDGCRKLQEKYNVVSIGIGSAGRVNPKLGVVEIAGNLPFRGEPIAARVAEATGLRVSIDNDANVALIGEAAAGVCKGFSDVVLITIGTGIGGAVMIDGKIYRGYNNRAGEFGHFIIKYDHPVRCECGLYGCFEQFASGTALINMTQKAVYDEPQSILAHLAESGVDGTTAFKAMRSGCETAREVVESYVKLLAVGINSMIMVFQPEVLVLSGGVSAEGEELHELLAPYIIDHARIGLSSLRGIGGMIGAALLDTRYGGLYEA